MCMNSNRKRDISEQKIIRTLMATLFYTPSVSHQCQTNGNEFCGWFCSSRLGKHRKNPTCRGMLDLIWGSWCEDGVQPATHYVWFQPKRQIEFPVSSLMEAKNCSGGVINIVTGVACCTCLLYSVQMAGNVPDLLTLLWDLAAGVPQPLQSSNLIPCVYWMWTCMNVHLDLFAYVCM